MWLVYTTMLSWTLELDGHETLPFRHHRSSSSSATTTNTSTSTDGSSSSSSTRSTERSQRLPSRPPNPRSSPRLPPLVTRIGSEHTEFVQWLRCARHADESREIHDFIAGMPQSVGRKRFRTPPVPELPCFPAHHRCWRAVFDGRVDVPESGATEPMRREGYVIQIAKVLEDDLGVDMRLTACSTSRFKEYHAAPSPPGDDPAAVHLRLAQKNWSQMHADWHESERYTFTAVLYLGDEEGDGVKLVGGETGIADSLQWDVVSAADGRTRLGDAILEPRPTGADGAARVPPGAALVASVRRGLVVEPKRGRLLLFSSGGENYHSPLEVAAGRRTAFHAWFACHDADGRAAALPPGRCGGFDTGVRTEAMADDGG